ncbi:hypothetical protein AGMMS49944_28550 [Spirochaetia bacterium]|nr:hypothetical protein AGMMS49944_28550 [Spirochaetia bacterium]
MGNAKKNSNEQKYSKWRKRNMRKIIPNAVLVITDTIECAIALGYNSEAMQAPIVLAKGKCFIAEEIKKIAEKSKVPIVENVSLTNQLYEKARQGIEIPGKYWETVANLMAKVLKKAQKKDEEELSPIIAMEQLATASFPWWTGTRARPYRTGIMEYYPETTGASVVSEKKKLSITDVIKETVRQLPVLKKKLAADDLHSLIVPQYPFSLEIGKDLIPLVEKKKGADLPGRINQIHRESGLELGLVIPGIRILDNTQLKPSEYCIKIKGVELGRGTIKLGCYLCINPGTVTTEIDGEKTKDPTFGLPALWISEENKEPAKLAGYTVVETLAIIATHLTDIIKRHAAEFLGRQETQDMLDALKKSCPAVAAEVQKVLCLGDIRKVLQALLREQVSIRNITDILEALADYGQAAKTVKSLQFLIEKARQALSRQICMQYADEDRVLRVLTISRDLEQKILDSSVETPSGIMSAMDPPTQTAWIKALRRSVATVRDQGRHPIILCCEASRFLVKSSTERELPDLVVLSVPEIVADVTVEVVGEIAIDSDKETL